MKLQMPTSCNVRYRLWYLGKPVLKLEFDKFGTVTKIVAGPGEPIFKVRGGRHLDAILSQDIEDLHAEAL